MITGSYCVANTSVVQSFVVFMLGDVIQVLLTDNVLLQPALWYTVIITFHFLGDRDQGSCRRGKGGSKTMLCEGVTFEFDRSDSGSLIPEVLFCRAF